MPTIRPSFVLALAAALLLPAGFLFLHPHAQAATNITVSRVEPYAETVNPASTLALTFSFGGVSPTDTPHRVFVQFLDASGNTVFNADHDPAQFGAGKPTTAWVGDISYRVPAMAVPAVPVGTYRIVIGLVDPATGARALLSRGTADSTVVHLGLSRYQVGLLNVTDKRIVDADLPCNGVTDVSQGLRNALDSLQPGDLLRLPAGTCVYSTVTPPPPNNCTVQEPLPLRLPHGARNIAVVGRGVPSTTLRAKNVDASAMFADGVQGLLIRDLALLSDSAGAQRRLCPVANGLSIFNSSAVDITRVQVSKSGAAGMLFFGVQDSRISNSRVLETLADGIQVTNSSRRITIEGNYVANTGDDSVSSIGHTPYLNENITIAGNTLVGSQASGVSVEGTSTVKVTGNVIQDSWVAGLRIASVSSFQTGPVNGLVASGNTLNGVRRNTAVDHAAVMIFADYGNLSNITITGNRINNAKTREGIRVRGSMNSAATAPEYWSSNIVITNNAMSDLVSRTLQKCVVQPLPGTVSNVFVSGNILNGAACPAAE